MVTTLSLLNRVVGATCTGSTANTSYPAANVQTPERPFKPWKTTVATASNIVIDFGTTTTLDVIALVNVNFTSASIQGNATNTWGAPTYDQSITIERNPWNTRYQHAHHVVGSFAFRFLRILIPTQTPLDGSVFSVGGIYAGANEELPRGIRADYQMQPHEPGSDIAPDGDAWLEHVVLGDVFTTIGARLTLEVGLPHALDDQTHGWLEILRQAPKASPLLLALEGAQDPAQCFVVRRLNDPQWAIDGAYANADLQWRELS